MPAEAWERAELWQFLDERSQVAGPALSIEYAPASNGGASSVELYAVLNGLGLRWRLRPDDWRGNPQEEPCIEVHARDGRPVGQSLLTQLGLGSVHRAVRYAFEVPATAAVLGERWGAVAARRPGRRGRDDLYYALVAQDYVEACRENARAPIQVMIKRTPGHATADEIRARLRRARTQERALLTRSAPGRAGGELTDKAKDVLRSAGLLRESENDDVEH